MRPMYYREAMRKHDAARQAYDAESTNRTRRDLMIAQKLALRAIDRYEDELIRQTLGDPIDQYI